MAERDLDVVVFGATGVTGRLVAAYLAEQEATTGARWAAAARDRDKLEAVLAEVGVEGAELIVADLGDPDSLAAMASRARTVLNMVGPYTLYARPVLEACVVTGAHYMDLTGEIAFARKVIDEFDGRARDAGMKVVQVSGFEALPPDLAVLLAAETARERWDEGLAEVGPGVATKPPGVLMPSDILSGGTLQSLAAITGAENARVATDPAALIDDPSVVELVRARSPIALAPRRGDGGAVIAPMTPSALINPAVIQRTAALLAAEEDRPLQPFRYREGVAIRGPAVTLPLRLAAAGTLSGVQAGMAAAARARPEIRRRVAGAMSSRASRIRLRAEGRADGGLELGHDGGRDHGRRPRAQGRGRGRRGIPATSARARMLGEAGLLLAEAGATPERSGCLTPAVAIGTQNLARFERARMRFSVGA